MASEVTKHNVILIMTDHQRWDTLGASGNTVIRTPHLDRLAAEGVTFETAITPSAVCSPARTALMTGYAPSRIHFTSNAHFLDDQADTLPARLNAAGYSTHALGKMHFPTRHNTDQQPWEVTYGFQNMVLSEETRWVRKARDLEHVAFDDYDKFLLERGLWGWDILPEIGYYEIKPVISPLPEEYGVTAWLGDISVEWLERQQAQPFFLFISFVKPHPPFDPPENWAGMYDPERVPLPVRAPHELERENPYYAQQRQRREWYLFSEKAERIARAYYYANISLIDKQVGRILNALENRGLRDSTYIIFTADHGEMLGDHWMWFKNLAYDGCTRVPLIMSGPGVPKGVHVRHSVVSTLDIPATILCRAGLSIPATWPGRDLLDYVRSGSPARSEYAIMEVGKYGRRCRAIRTLDWLYVHWENGGYEELYDLRADPHQLHDLARSAAHAGTRRELQSTLIGWLRAWGDASWEFDDHGHLTEHPFETGQQRRTIPQPISPAAPQRLVPPERRDDNAQWQLWWWQALVKMRREGR